MTKLISPKISEESIHKTVIEWIRLHNLISPLVIHIPNQGIRTKRFGGILKAMGMRAGVADLFIAMGCHNYHGAWIELKSEKGKLSPVQQSFLHDMRTQNYFVAVCYSVDEAIATIKWYCDI